MCNDSISSVDTHISLDIKNASDYELDTDSCPEGHIVNCIQEVDTLQVMTMISRVVI